MKRSISIINTEIQLINVIEAIHHFECKDNYLVIGQFNIRMDRIQKIEDMLKEPLFRQHFRKIIHLPLYLSNKNPLRFLGYILAYIKFFFLILCSKKFDNCFFGVITDIIVKPITFLSYYKNPQCTICVIDEGARTSAEASERVQNKELLIEQQKKKIHLIPGYCLAILRKWIYPSITYFSIYHPSLLPQDKLIKNNYSFFKQNKLPNIHIEENSVVIVGQALYELRIMSLETYRKTIEDIIAKYEGLPIYYAPHPIEKEYINWMPKHVQFLQTPYPLELVLIARQLNTIIGFYSAALFNCAYMGLCDNIISISIDEQLYNTILEIVKENNLNINPIFINKNNPKS